MTWTEKDQRKAEQQDADDLAVAIEELLGLPEETIATEGKARVSLNLSEARALIELARRAAPE